MISTHSQLLTTPQAYTFISILIAASVQCGESLDITIHNNSQSEAPEENPTEEDRISNRHLSTPFIPPLT